MRERESLELNQVHRGWFFFIMFINITSIVINMKITLDYNCEKLNNNFTFVLETKQQQQQQHHIKIETKVLNEFFKLFFKNKKFNDKKTHSLTLSRSLSLTRTHIFMAF